jgi:hypothetical protein
MSTVRSANRTGRRATPVEKDILPVQQFDVTTETIFYRELQTAAWHASVPVHIEPVSFISSIQVFEHFLHDGFLRSSIYKFLLCFGMYNE